VKRSVLALATLSIIFLSCSKEKQEGKVLIRVQNQTGQQLSDISIFSVSANTQSEREEKYGSVFPGMSSPYRQYEIVYNLPLFKSFLEGYGAFEVMSVCGTGLSHLEDGKYSLIIKMENNNPYTYFQKD
jgi:hypothetical protein